MFSECEPVETREPEYASLGCVRQSRSNMLLRLLKGGLKALRCALLCLLGAAALPLSAEVLYAPINGLSVAKQKTDRVGCASHLQQILQAAEAWSLDHADAAPPGLEAITNELGSPAVLFCPANFRRLSATTNWANLNWNSIDYAWIPTANWADPTNVVCECRVHEHVGLADGSVKMGGYRNGRPWVTAAPWEAMATPGETIRFEVRVTPTALKPLSFQWRREQVHYETNVAPAINPDDPTGIYWQTNVIPVFTGTDLAGETNGVVLLSGAQPNDSGYYSAAVSNAMGTEISSRAALHVDPSLAGITTNEQWSEGYCLNNLRMLALLGGLWASDNHGRFPQDLSEITNVDGSWMFGWPCSLFCRSDTNRPAPADWSQVDFSDTSYEILSSSSLDPLTIFCRCRFHAFYAQRNGEVMWRPLFTGIRPLADHTLDLSFRVFAGKTNILEASTNLASWTEINQSGPEPGEVRFTDREAMSRRFYRIRLP
jgi:hypothetical protein